MTLDNRPVHFGGCQCGAVRFRVEGALGKASICHCRMCQKAFGAFYAPLVSVEAGTLSWTKAEPSRFRSSDEVQRGFCPSCGTPLTYEAPDGTALAIGAFDDPSTIAPQIQFGVEDKLAFVDRLADLPARRSSDDVEANPYLGRIRSRQHPDHE